jgi:hypothetical protein
MNIRGITIMISFLSSLPKRWLLLALGLSAGITLSSLILAPIVIARLPSHYFQQRPHRPPKPKKNSKCLVNYVATILKNLLGGTLILAGAAMIPLPGQGILTMIVGLSLVDLPGKHHLLRAMGSQPKILRSLNWMRNKLGKPPFLNAEAL